MSWEEKEEDATYPHAVVESDNAVQLNVVWVDPRHPVENTESLEEGIREPKVNKHSTEGNHEELVAGHGHHPPEGADHRPILAGLLVEGVQQSDGGEGVRPDAVGRVDQELAADSGESIAEEVGRQADQDLVEEVASIALVEILREVLDPDDVLGEGGRAGDGRHDGDQEMLLLGERTGVQAVPGPEEGESPVRQPSDSGAADRVRSQLRDVPADVDAGLADGKQLVDEGHDHREGQAKDPDPDRGRRNGRVVLVAHDSSHLGVGAIVSDQSHFQLDLFHPSAVQLRVGEDIFAVYKTRIVVSFALTR